MKNAKVKMIILSALMLLSSLAKAEAKVECQPIEGQFANSVLELLEPVRLIADSDQWTWTFSRMEKLVLNVTGRAEDFSLKGVSIDSGITLDLVHSQSPEVKAVFMIDRVPGKIKRKFEALLVVIGINIEGTSDGVPVLSKPSLVYNLRCVLK